MSAQPVDVLAVMERDEIDAHAWRCAAEPKARARGDSQAARAAVAELIEADREYDAAIRACCEANGASDEARAAAGARMGAAFKRRDAALARCGGAA